MSTREQTVTDAPRRWSLQTWGLVLGLVIALGTVGGGVMTLGTRLAERDFLTVTASEKREAVLTRQLEARIASSEALASQREAALAAKIETIAQTQAEANARMQNQLDRIYQLLLSRR